MSFYNKCIYGAVARCHNPEIESPTDKNLFFMHTEGVIIHLSDIHDQCWPEVCWFHDSPDMTLVKPNLKKYTKNQKSDLLEFLKRIMDLKGKSLITTIRTSANEAVNRVKLNYTNKKTDYPKSFAARYALAVIHNNNGIIQVLKVVRKVAYLVSFSEQDHLNLLQLCKERENKREYNITKINEKNQTRAQKICEQKKRLKGFDFGQVRLFFYLILVYILLIKY